MFTRVVELTSKSGKTKELANTINEKVVPILKKQRDFVEFQVQCTSVPILSVLDQKNDEKRDDRGRGIYDQLPGVRIMKIRTGGAPKYDNEHRQYECPSRSYPSGGFGSYRSEPNTECLIFLVLFHSAHLVWCA